MVVALEWLSSSLVWYYFVQILGAFPATTGKTSAVEAWFGSALPSWKSWSKFSRWNWWVWLDFSVAQLFCHFHSRNCFEGRIIYRKERFYDLWIFYFQDNWYMNLYIIRGTKFSYIFYYFDLSAAEFSSQIENIFQPYNLMIWVVPNAFVIVLLHIWRS